MIITRTPFRVSLFGGGTDYPAWSEQHGGDVLGFAIDKYCWITLRRLPAFFPYKHRIVYSKIELVDEIADIGHPAVRAILSLPQLRDLGPDNFGIELHHDGDLPARSGLGSSSSFAVGLLNAVGGLVGYHLTRRLLANEATRIERDVLAESVGQQDQVWAAYGGFNRIRFPPAGGFTVNPVVIPPIRQAELMASLMLFFTGFSRTASAVASAQLGNFPSRQTHLARIKAMVPEALHALGDAATPVRQIGAMLDETWGLKRALADAVSTPAIDEIYDAAREAGALGGKLLGAGGGGFMLFYVPPEAQDDVRARLKTLVEVRFQIAAEGSQIVLYEPNGFH